MGKIKLLYIDEDEEARDAFADYVEDTPLRDKFILKVLPPLITLENQVNWILENYQDVIVTDYQLNELAVDGEIADFNGAMLYNALMQKMKNYPCFVITNFEEDALKNMDNVNYVYDKNVLASEIQNGGISFLEKIKIQAEKYEVRVREAKSELSSLASRNEPLDHSEMKRLEELDELLESYLSNESKLARRSKDKEVLNTLGGLIEKTEELLNEVKDARNS